jgi:hypothetical protein
MLPPGSPPGTLEKMLELCGGQSRWCAMAIPPDRMKLYIVESYGDESTTTHGIYTTRALAEEAKRRWAADDIREEETDDLPQLPSGEKAYRVIVDGDKVPMVELHEDPWVVWRHPGGGVREDGRIVWTGFAAGWSEAAEKAKAAAPRYIEQEKEMAMWRDASNKAIRNAFTQTVGWQEMLHDGIKPVDFKFNHRVQVNDES